MDPATFRIFFRIEYQLGQHIVIADILSSLVFAWANQCGTISISAIQPSSKSLILATACCVHECPNLGRVNLESKVNFKSKLDTGVSDSDLVTDFIYCTEFSKLVKQLYTIEVEQCNVNITSVLLVIFKFHEKSHNRGFEYSYQRRFGNKTINIYKTQTVKKLT